MNNVLETQMNQSTTEELIQMRNSAAALVAKLDAEIERRSEPAPVAPVESTEPAPVERSEHGELIVTAKGKRYVVSSVNRAIPKAPGVTFWRPNPTVSYWTERDGKSFGATRGASSVSKPGTVAHAVWAAQAALQPQP